MMNDLFSVLHRTQTGGQPSESSQLPDASPLLPHCAPPGDFHMQGNEQGAGLQKQQVCRLNELTETCCSLVLRCLSTSRVQSAAGGTTVRSRGLCQNSPSLSAPVPPAACRGSPRPWKTVRHSASASFSRSEGSALTRSSCRAGYQLRASIYSYGPPDGQPPTFSLDAGIRSAEALSGRPQGSRPDSLRWKHNKTYTTNVTHFT